LNLRTAVAALAALAGLGLSWPVLAQWVDLGEDSSFRYSVDPASLRGDRTRRTVLALFNARTPGQRVQSMRVVLEADCLDARVRIVSRTLHASPMGVGSELSLPIAASSAWDYVRPGSANEVLRRWACDAGDPSAAGAVAGAPAAGAGSAPPAPASAAAGPAGLRSTAPGGSVSVPIRRQGGTFTVPAEINERVTLRFIVDSGASDVNIPSDVVAGMLASGALSRSDFLGRRDYVLADGSRISAETFRIRSLRIGGRVVEDVVATAGALSSPFLLGQSFLRKLKSWSIDNANDTLVLE
jgi:clan AA aspartic protease (TIGR02281 family)